MITEELNEFNHAGRPHHLARPGIDSERFRPDLEPPLSREALGIAPDEFVIVYHGTVHYANQHEMLSLYLAVKLLQRRGRKVRLVRLGETELGGVDPRSLGALRDGVIELGSVGWREIPGYLALADAFVQPGAPDDFNRYRLPVEAARVPRHGPAGDPPRLQHRPRPRSTARARCCSSTATGSRSPPGSSSCSTTRSCARGWPRARATSRSAELDWER